MITVLAITVLAITVLAITVLVITVLAMWQIGTKIQRRWQIIYLGRPGMMWSYGTCENTRWWSSITHTVVESPRSAGLTTTVYPLYFIHHWCMWDIEFSYGSVFIYYLPPRRRPATGDIAYLPPRRRPGTGDIAMPPSVCPSICPSICLSVTFSFRTVIRKRIDVFSMKLCRYVYHVIGVCCIVLDIDGVLFEFFKNF